MSTSDSFDLLAVFAALLFVSWKWYLEQVIEVLRKIVVGIRDHFYMTRLLRDLPKETAMVRLSNDRKPRISASSQQQSHAEKVVAKKRALQTLKDCSRQRRK